jgi:hypothetical protein
VIEQEGREEREEIFLLPDLPGLPVQICLRFRLRLRAEIDAV